MTGRALLWIAGGLLLVLTMAWSSGLRLNLTGSLPVGLYVRVQGVPTRGSIVLACLPPNVAVFARARGYVPRGDQCPGHTAPVGKTVVAIPGDTLLVSPSGLEVNGHPVPNSRARPFDTRGRSLASARVGRSIVPAGEVWLVSSYTPLSFDSRYFGPIDERSVVALVRPLWTARRP